MSGWEHEKKVLNQPEYYWHNGMSGGYYSFLAIDKKNKVGVAILSNEAKMLTYQQIRTFEIIRKRALKKQIKNFDIK
jgi:CubicO group peptidase (beta-lactamase class C family)